LADSLITAVGWVIDLVRWGAHISRVVVEFLRLQGVFDSINISLGDASLAVRFLQFEFWLLKKTLGLIAEAALAVINALMLVNHFKKNLSLKGFKTVQETWDDANAKTRAKEDAERLTSADMARRDVGRAEKQGFNYGMPAGEFGPPTADVDARRAAFLERTRRGMPGREEAPGGVDFNAAYAATAGNLSLLAPQGPGLPQGMGPMGGKGAATERTAAASEKTAATTTQQTAILQGIHNFLQSSGGLTVNMDGEKVGALIAKHGVAVGGTH
jgi:hypothetical protein